MRIDISKESRSRILVAFYEAARPPGTVIINEDLFGDKLKTAVESYLGSCEAFGSYYTDFLLGCNLSLDLQGPEMDLTAYIQANGKSAALKAIAGLQVEVLPVKQKLKGWAYLKDKYKF